MVRAMNVLRVRISDEASVHHRPASRAGHPNDPRPAKCWGRSRHRLPVTTLAPSTVPARPNASHGPRAGGAIGSVPGGCLNGGRRSPLAPTAVHEAATEPVGGFGIP